MIALPPCAPLGIPFWIFLLKQMWLPMTLGIFISPVLIGNKNEDKLGFSPFSGQDMQFDPNTKPSFCIAPPSASTHQNKVGLSPLPQNSGDF